jgi:hypothetical protein
MRVDILHHLFAPLMLEIDVDVWRLVAFGRDETFEQKIMLRRIDFRDAKAKADLITPERQLALAGGMASEWF